MIKYKQASKVEVEYKSLKEYADSNDNKHKYEHCDVNY